MTYLACAIGNERCGMGYPVAVRADHRDHAASQGQDLHDVRGADLGGCHLRPAVPRGDRHRSQRRVPTEGPTPQKLSMGSTHANFDRRQASLRSDRDPMIGTVDLLAGIRNTEAGNLDTGSIVLERLENRIHELLFRIG